VDAYWKEVNHYILVVEKDLFSDTFITAHTVNAIDNCMGYTIWITSKTHFADVRHHVPTQRFFNCLINMWFVAWYCYAPQTLKLFTARKRIVEQLVWSQRQVGIKFMNIPQPVDIIGGGKGPGTVVPSYEQFVRSHQ
jgi:hypothetical protein